MARCMTCSVQGENCQRVIRGPVTDDLTASFFSSSRLDAANNTPRLDVFAIHGPRRSRQASLAWLSRPPCINPALRPFSPPPAPLDFECAVPARSSCSAAIALSGAIVLDESQQTPQWRLFVRDPSN